MKRWKLFIYCVSFLLAAAGMQLLVSQKAYAATKEFQTNKDILVKYVGKDSTVNIPDNIKIIGSEAFIGNTTITKVTIPKSVERIEYGAFSGCTSLTGVTIPSSVTEVDTSAFKNCTALKTAKLGEGVKRLGTGVFAGCTNLRKISVSSKNKNFKYDKYALYNKDKTKLYQVLDGNKKNIYEMPDSVKTIGEYAFWGCEQLESVVISDLVTEIPPYAFSNCKNLKSVELSFAIKDISMKAFEDCVNLGKITIPASVTKIHETAFDGCTKVKIIAEEETAASEFAKGFEEKQALMIAKEKEKQKIKKSLAQKQESNQSTDQKKTDSKAGVSDNSSAQAESDLLLEETGVLGKGKVVGNQVVIQMGDGSEKVFSGKNIKQSNPKNTIGDQAHYKERDLKTFEIPAGIKNIGQLSFARSGLTEITIPDTINSIGYAAFYHCDDLEKVTISDEVNNIDSLAFAKTKWMSQWKQNAKEDDFLIVGNGILIGYKGTAEKVVVPDGVRSITSDAFQGNRTITEVQLPDSVKTIAEGTFEGCDQLKNVPALYQALFLEQNGE